MFLPVLLFASSFAAHWHTVRRQKVPILLLVRGIDPQMLLTRASTCIRLLLHEVIAGPCTVSAARCRNQWRNSKAAVLCLSSCKQLLRVH